MNKEKELLEKLKTLDKDIARKVYMAKNKGMPYYQIQELCEKIREESGYNDIKSQYETLCRKNTKKDLIVIIVALSVALIASIIYKFLY